MKYTLDDVDRRCAPHWDGGAAEISVGAGWADAIVAGIDYAESYDPNFVLYQVKEKFGELRFYSSLPLEVSSVVESFADGVCEVCGEPGVASSVHGWVSTLCEEHATQK